MPFNLACGSRQSSECDYPHWSMVIRGVESDPVFHQALIHVEHCPICQSRIESSATDGISWWREAKQSWLELEIQDTCGESIHASVIIEVQPEMPEDSRIEFETVALSFLEPPSHPELLGRLGRYEVERVIGVGGMGVVLKAHDTELHRPVAIKILANHLANNASARRRFAREAQAAAAVLHPNVIPIYNVESDGATPYLVMQFVNGQSLQARIDHDGPLPAAEVLRIATQTASGLSAAHDQGLVHRDVKPANILLHDNVDRVVLSDFGLARAVDDASLTRTGIVAGTPHYMSPEQARGDAIDTRSDQFSLGCVIYFALTGRPPFRANGAMGVLHRICNDAHRPIEQVNSDVPIEVGRLVDRLMAKSASNRFQSMHAVHEELSNLLGAIQSGRLSLAKPSVKSSRDWWRHPAVAWISLAVAVGIMASTIPFMRDNAARGKSLLRIDERNAIYRQLENHAKQTSELDALQNSIEYEMRFLNEQDRPFLQTTDANFIFEVQTLEMKIREMNNQFNPSRNEDQP